MPSSKNVLRSQCPVGFEAVNLSDSKNCPVLEDVLSDNNNSSLWLIKVPHDFDLESLSGQDVILNGSQDLPPGVPQGTDKRYEVQSKTGCTAELSSFTVLLPSSQRKSLCSAGSFSGQMSVIQSVVVPPSTLPETSLPPKKKPPSEYIRTWTPFGCRKPKGKSNSATDEMARRSPVKEKKRNSKGRNEAAKESLGESPKHKKSKRKGENVAASIGENAKNKSYSPKKKKDKDTHEVDLSRVKIEPGADVAENFAVIDCEHAPRKRKTEMFETQQNGEDPMLTPSKKKKKRKSVSTVNQESVMLDGKSPHYQTHQGGATGVSDMNSVNFDLTRVKTEPKESSKKKKHSKTKTH